MANRKSPPSLPARSAVQYSDTTDVVREEVFENRRGCCLFGMNRFTATSLLPTDVPPWSTVTGIPAIDRMSFPVSSGWEWISDWAVDMRGDVDADGWAYATGFKSRDWSGIATQGHYVCRRAWFRMRRRLQSTSPSPPFAGRPEHGKPNSGIVSTGSGGESAGDSIATSTEMNDAALVLQIPTLMRSCILDRQKVDAVADSLGKIANTAIVPAYSVEAICHELEYDKSRLHVAKLLVPFLDKEGLVAALFQIQYHSSRLQFLERVGKDSFLAAFLVVQKG